MTSTSRPVRILLVGGGHAHVEVVRRLGRDRSGAIDLTLVSPAALTPYSGLLPSHVAGLVDHATMHVDLRALAEACGTRFVEAAALCFDRTTRRVEITGGEALPYDLLSIDVGSAPDLDRLPGAAEHALSVKPIDRFLRGIDDLRVRLRAKGGDARLVVVGGGAAGAEIAMALRVRLADQGITPAVTMVAAEGLVPTLNGGVRRRLAAALGRHGIVVLNGRRATQVRPGELVLDDGDSLVADAVVVATGARSPSVLESLGLPLGPGGALPVGPTLQALGDADVFAAGDCAHLSWSPREKAGVFAVRQGPILAANLLARATGAPLEPYRPQSAYLVLLSMADGRAIAGRGRYLAAEGPLVYRWKRALDLGFMKRYSTPKL